MRLIFFLLFLIFFQTEVFAQSSYVLPYPSNMPGSYFYKLDQVKEKILKFWYFGDFGEFKYNLKFADKYLVEAKTLFEYKQYLLGIEALNKSDSYFKKIESSLKRAKENGKEVSDKEKILKEASLKHIKVLEKIQKEIPENFTWEPEKSKPVRLELKKEIDESVLIRE